MLKRHATPKKKRLRSVHLTNYDLIMNRYHYFGRKSRLLLDHATLQKRRLIQMRHFN